MSKLSRWLSLVSVLGAASGSAFGQNSYTNAVNGTELWGLAGQWTNELGLNGVPGYNVVTGTGNSNDDAVVLMVAGTPNLNLAGTGYVLRSLFLYENTNANVNIDGNIVSFGAAGASLTMERLDYYLGGRTLDFATPVSLNDKTDGNAFVLRSVASGLDIGGTFTGTEGLRIEGNQTLLLRKYNFSYGAGISNGIVNEGVAGGGSTRVFGMNSTSSSTHDIPNFVTLNDGAFNTIFQRTAGANALDVNINNLEFGTNTIQLRLGGQASPVDGAPIVTVNVNDQIDFSNLQVGNQDITFNFESAFGGIVNFNSNVVINQGIHLDKSVIFNGNGVVNVNADPIRYGFSDPVTMTHILDGARSLTVAVNDEGRLGQGIVDLRPGTVLRLNYDAFGDADGFPGTSMRYGAGTNNLYYDFGAVQSGFYDPVIGDANTPLQVRAFMGVGGRLDNAVYSGVNQNIALYTNAIIAEGSSNLPTRAELGGAILWEGIRNAGGTYTDIGDDGSTSIFRGVAIGALANLGTGADLLSTSGTNVEAETFIGGFHGSLTARAGQDLEVLLPSGDGVVFTPYTNGQVATFNADTGIANVRGMGNMQIQQRSGVLAIGGTATNINRIGYDGTFSDDNPLGTNTQNNVILDLVAAQSIPSNFVFTVTDGRVQVRATDGIGQATGSSNATLIAGSGATLWLDNAGGQANITLNRGKIIIGPGGAFWTGTGDDNAGATTTVISNMVIDPQSLLIVNDGSPTFGGAGGVRVMTNVLYSHLLTNMNIVFSDDGMKTALVETVNSFAIGNNRRLTISGSEGGNLERIVATVGATNNTAVLAAFGASNVFITASAGQTFNIRPEIATTNATVTTFNDTVPFTTVRGDGTMRQTVNQTGTINLYGATNRFNDVSFHGGSINITSNNVLTVGRDIWVTNGATANIQSTNALGRNIGVAQFRDVVNYGALEFKGATSIVNLAESRSGAVRFYGGYSEISNAFASGGGDLLFGDTTNDVTRIFGGIHVVDATNDTSLVSLQNGFVRVDGDILFEPTSNTNLAPGAFASPELRLRASTNLILGSVYLGPTNGIGGSGTLRVGDNDTDVTIIGGDLVINSPAVRQSNRGVEFNRGDVVVSNNIVINPYRLSRFAVTNDLVFNPDGDASRLWIQAQTDTNLTDGFGMYDRLRDGTLALGPDGIRINDYGNLLIELNRTNAVAGGYTIAQKITVDTSGPNYGGTDQKTMWLRAVTNTWDKIVGTGSTPIFNVTNVWMRENAHLRIDEENTEARLGLILMGTNAFLSESSSGTGSGSNEDFDLLDVQSDLAGQARNLYIGTTNGVSDATFESVLFGTGSADVTFNVFNGRLSMTNGGAINGTATVTRDNSIFDILPGTTGDVREVVMQAGWFSNRGDSVNISNLSVSGGFAYLDGGSSFVSNLYMAGGTSAVAAAGVAFDRVTFDGGAFRAVSNYHMAANTVITTNGGGTIVVDDTQTLSVNNVIEGNGGLAKNGLGTLVLSNQNTFLGGATVNEGTLFLAGNNRLATNGNITVVGGVLDLGGNNQDNAAEMIFQGGLTTNGTITKLGSSYDGRAGTVAANLEGPAGLTKTTAGTLILSGSNSYSGETLIAGGSLRIDSANALPGGIGTTGGTSTLNLTNGGVLGINIAQTFTRDLGTGIEDVRWSDGGGFAAYGADRHVNIGGNTQTLSFGQANFVGLDGELVFGADDSTHTLVFENPFTLVGTNRFRANNGFAAVDGRIIGDIDGTGSFWKTGDGVLELTGSNTYSGGTEVLGGQLLLSGSNSLSANSLLTISNFGVITLGATDFTRNLGTNGGEVVWTGSGGFAALGADRAVNLGGNTQQVVWGSGFFVPEVVDGSVLVLGRTGTTHTVDFQNDIDLGASNRTVRAGDGDAAIDGILSGVLTGSGGLTKTGPGNLLINNTNLFTGGFAIEDGVVYLAGGDNRLDGANALTLGSSASNFSGALVLGSGGTKSDQTFSGIATAGTGISNAIIGGASDISTLTLDLAGGVTNDYRGVLGAVGIPNAENLALTKSGDGLLILSGINSYTGMTLVTGGTLAVGRDAALGGDPLSLITNQLTLNGGTLRATNTFAMLANRGTTLGASGGTIEVDGSRFVTNLGGIFGSGGLTKSGNGVLILTKDSEYSGNTVVAGGVLRLDQTNALPGGTLGAGGPGNLMLTNGGIIGLGATNLTLGLGTGAGQIQFTGDGGFAAYNATANRTVNIGGAGATLTWGSGGFVPDGNALILATTDSTNTLILANGINLGAGSVATQREFRVNNAGSVGDDASLVGVISGTASNDFRKTGAGRVLLTRNNTFAGRLIIEQGVVNITNELALNDIAGSYREDAVLLDGGTLLFSGGANFTLDDANRGFMIGASNGTLDVASGRTITMTNTFIAGSGDLTKAGSGALEFRMLSNRFTGRTILTGGALSIDSEADLGIAPGSFVTNQLQLNGGTLRTLGPNNSTLLLDDPTRGILLTGDSAFDVNAASKTMIVSNEIAGAAGQDLQKVGAGLLILGGTNTYLGATVVRAGVLAVGEEASLGGNPATFQAGQLTISNAATFRALDTFAIDDSRRGITLGNGGGFISVDADETLTISNVVAGIGTLTKVGNGTLILAATTNTYSGVLGRSTGITTIAGGTLAINNELKLGVLTNDAVPFVANALTISNGGILRALGSFTIDDPWRGVEVGTGGGGFEADSGATLTLASNLITANLITKYGNGVLAINGTSNVLGNVVVTNGGLTFHDADTDQTLINGSLVFSEVTNSPNTTYSRVNRGDFSVTNDILINVGGAKPQTTANAQFKIEATTNDFGTLGDGMGLLERLVNGTLAQGANGVVVGDYARFEIGVPRTNALVTIGQKITIATTGPNYSGDQRNLDFRAENVGTFNTGTMRFDVTNVVMRDGSYLRVNEVNSEVRMGLSLEGTGYLSKSTSAENEDFDLLNVVSSSPGSARTLQIGTINGVSDQPFRSVLFGTGSEDVTFDVYRGKLTMTNGAAIYGTAKVSSGVSSFEILQGTTGYVRQVLVQDGAFSNRGDQVSFSNVVVSGGFAYLDGGESYVTNLYMSGGTSIVATAGVSLGQATFDGGTLRAINDRYLNAFTGVTFTNGGGTITVDPGATLVMDDAMDGNGGLTKIGTGTLVLSNANTYLGGTTLRDGTMLLAGGNDRLASGGNLTIEGGTLDLDGNDQNNSAAVSFQGGLTTNGTITKTGAAFDAQAGIIEAILAGDAGLTKTGTGTVTLVGGSANTFTGLTTVSGGTLALNKTPGVNAIVGDGVGSKTSNDILINGGTLLWLASNQVDNTATITMTSGTMNLNGKKETLYEFHNLGGTFKSGRGGGLTVIDPTWGEGSTNLLEAGTTDSYGNLVIAGGFNRVHGAEDFGTPASLTVGTGGLVFSNSTSPSLILSADHNAAGSLILGGDVSFVGSSGTASIASGPALLYDGENYSVDGDQTGLVRGFVDLNGGTRTFDIGNGASAVDMSVTANIVNLSNSVAGLLKSGVGTLLLGGTNSYDGPTTVGAGTLLVNGDNSLAQGLVTVLGGGTLGGNGTIGGQAIFEAGSTNAPGFFGPGVQTFANGMVFSNAAVFQWELTTNASALALRGSFFDGVDMSSNLLEIASGATMSLVFNRPDSSVNWSDTFWDTNQSWLVFDMIGSGATNGGTANFALDSSFLDSLGNDLATARPGWGFYTSFDGNGDLYLNYAIPEPGTWALMVVGLGLIGYLRRRRKG